MIAQRLPIPEFSIREMELDDLAQVYHLGERLFTKDRYPFLYSTWDKREVLGHFNMEPELSLVADADGALAGFIIGTLIAKASWTYGYIVWVGVDRVFQSSGVAHELYGRLVARMVSAGAHQLVVDTDASNDQALRFFAKKGFEDEREHVVLTLDLTSTPRTPATTEAYVEGRKDYAPLPKATRPSWKKLSQKLRSWNRISVLTNIIHCSLFGH
jgi:ribosomal protein S18 acetylase RimI-like enzyme